MPLSPRTLHAFKWSALAEVATRAMPPLSFLVLARLLVPEDFGVVAAATVVISFSQAIADAGLAKALIQRQSRIEECANAAFWISLSVGLGIAGILFLIAPWVAAYFDDGRITTVIRVLTIQLILSSAASTHAALLQKELAFNRLFRIRLAGATVPVVFSIALAIDGFGYWALVAGTVAGQLLQTILAWRATTWQPRRSFNLAVASELFAFGKWSMLTGMLAWFRPQASRWALNSRSTRRAALDSRRPVGHAVGSCDTAGSWRSAPRSRSAIITS